jgi:ATP-dependent helicase HrpB
MVGGSGVRIGDESIVKNAELFVAVDARRDSRSRSQQAIVRIASAIEPAWLEELFPQSIRRQTVAEFDKQRGRVIGVRRTMYRDLVLREDFDAPVSDDDAARVLAEQIAPRVDELLKEDEYLAPLVARLQLLAEHLPEHSWPVGAREAASGWIQEATHGARTLDEAIRRLPQALKNQLVYPLDRLLDQHAPETIQVPTGNRIKIDYKSGQRPVLAVRLQEVFGWLDTPRIANGRVPLLMHLLGPNYRPVQITDDLRSFWSTTYFQVRKDLRVRYPKHSWPEDPLTATPQAKGRPRQ